MKVFAYTKIQWIPSRIHLGANVSSTFWARIIKPKGARSLGFSWFSSFVDSQQFFFLYHWRVSRNDANISCVWTSWIEGDEDTSHFFRTPAAAETVEETAATEAGGKVEKAQEDAGATVKRGVSLHFTIDAVKNLPFTLVCWRNVFFFPKLRWKAILKDRVFQSSTFAKNSRRSSASQTGSRMENTMKSAGKVWSYTGLWMGWDDENGGGGDFFFKSENKSAENFDTSVLPQLQFLVHFWCFSFFFRNLLGRKSSGGGYRSEPILQLLTAWGTQTVSQTLLRKKGFQQLEEVIRFDSWYSKKIHGILQLQTVSFLQC